MNNRMKWLISRAADLLFPPCCVVCDEPLCAEERGVHEACRKKLVPMTGPVCFACGRPVRSERQEYCAHCSGHLPPFVQGKALFLYKGSMKNTMYRFKYGNRREYAAFFAQQTLLLYRDWLRAKQIDVILTVPMYGRKKRIRGYNQAEVFAAELAAAAGIPCASDVLYRKTDTRALKTFDERRRRQELKGAFGVRGERLRELDAHRFLLVDDIYTTGATVREITETLAKASARGGGIQVYVLAICTAETLG